MDPTIDKREFAARARRGGVPLSDDDITRLYEGYGWFERLVVDLGRPTDPRDEPAPVFTPEIGP